MKSDEQEKEKGELSGEGLDAAVDQGSTAVEDTDVGGVDLDCATRTDEAELGATTVADTSAGSGSDSEDIDLAADLLKLSEELESLRGEKQEAQEKYVRLLADFDNYKKNTAKQRQDLLKYQGQALVTDLLAVLDNFEYALQSSEETAGEGSFRAGIEMIRKSFLDTLERWGIKGESSVGQVFDPSKHSALGMVLDNEARPGTVLRELKKAFYYKDRLLRPAEVIVVKEPEEGEALSI